MIAIAVLVARQKLAGVALSWRQQPKIGLVSRRIWGVKMSWPWILAIVVALIAGFWLGSWGASLSIRDAARQMLRTQAIDRNNYLRVLRRELANHLMQRDAVAYERLYERVSDEVAKYSTFSKEGLRAEARAIAERYPQYGDFDMVGTREHVLYPDAMDWNDDESVSEHFRNIVRFQAANALLDENWKYFHAVSEDDRKHLHEYVQRVLDSRLRRKLRRAIEIYYRYRGDELNFENDEFSVVWVSHIAEARQGVHFKRTDEYGLHWVFDDHSGYYASDSTFQMERRLNTVRDSYEEAERCHQ